MIKIISLSHKYQVRDEVVLKDINLTIEQGENVVIIGKSGSGKSTLMKCINRLIEPSSGSISIDGRDILKCDRREINKVRRNIGLIFQGFNLVERATVYKNVLDGRLGYVSLLRTCFNKFSKEDYEIVERSVERMGLSKLKHEKVCNLSGGQKQRVAIARSLAQMPEIILADEPVSSLDPKLMREIMDLLQAICKEMTITLITSLHFLELVKKYASRVIGIREGVVIFDNDIETLSEKDLIDVYGETKEWKLYGKLGF